MGSGDRDHSVPKEQNDYKVVEDRVDDSVNTSSQTNSGKGGKGSTKEDDSPNTTHSLGDLPTDVQQTSQSEEAVDWVPVWNEEHNANYWWNTTTNETTWEDPTTGTNEEQKSESAPYSYDEQQIPHMPYYGSEPYGEESYTTQGYFNSRTGKFSSASEADRYDPQSMSVESRATRQMSYFFDVDKYTEERNRDRMLRSEGKPPRPSRKDIKKFEKKRKAKKDQRKREWLLE